MTLCRPRLGRALLLGTPAGWMFLTSRPSTTPLDYEFFTQLEVAPLRGGREILDPGESTMATDGSNLPRVLARLAKQRNENGWSPGRHVD